MSPARLLARGDVPLERRLLRYERARTVAAWLAATFAAVALVVVVLTNVTAADSRDRILSCTDPGDPDPGVTDPRRWEHPPGACYLEGQERTAGLVGDPPGGINTVVVAAAACARAVVEDTDTDVEAQAATLQCTQDALERTAAD